MKSDTPLDYAVFQLSPRRSRCELFVSSAGNTEKLASGLVKPFVSHLKVAEEQVALAVQSIKLEVERRKNAETWFTKGTLERFVRFVSTPEVLELVNTYDAEMSQLEAARRIYSQGAGDQLAGTLSGDGVTAAADATKKELLKAIDVRLVAVRQDLTTACARAEAAGFTPDTISELQLFADQFGAGRLNEACNKFISVCERRPDLINPWKAGVDDRAVRSSCGSDMSIDEDPTDDQPGCGPNHRHSAGREPDSTQQHFDPSKPSTWQQPTKPSSVVFPIRRSRESSVDREDSKEKKDEIVTQNEPTQPTQPARRLSVQDRINLFENKQKESGGGGGGGGSGGKPAVAKSAELRRLSSDVSSAPTVAAEKAVLRRWSGASDMSIDLGGEKKDIENPLFTPPSSSVSQTKSEEQKALNDRADSQVRAGQEEVVETKVGLKRGTQLTTNDSESTKLTSTLGRVGSGDWKDRTRGKTQTQTQSRSSFGSAGDESLRDQVSSQTQFTPLPGGIAEQIGLTEQRRFKGSFSGNKRGGIEEQVVAGEKDQAVPQTQLGAEGVGSTGQLVSQFRAHPKTAVDSGQLEGGSGEKSGEAPAVQYKGIEGDSLASPSQWRSFGEVEEVGKKELGSSDKQPVNFTTKGEDSGLHRMKFQKQVSVSEQIKKSQGRREESLSDYRNSRPVFSGKMISEGQEDVGTVPAVSGEQAQRVRQSKGNQERNDELKMKANELEKLFAEHKLRVPGEQSSSARRNKPADMQIEQAVSFPYRKPPAETASAQLPDKNTVNEPLRGSSILSQFSVTPPMKTLDNQKNGDSLKQNFSELGLSDDSRGKFYERYIQKRDAKLREEWGSKRAEKEAKMKAMHDSFERSRAEMRAKFSGSAERQDSAFSARRRAERLRSFNTRSTLKREQHPIDLLQSEDDEDLSEFAEQIPIGHDRFFGETSLGDTASKSTQNKKLLLNKNLSSSTPRTSAVPVPRSAVKSSNPSSGRRRMQSENLLAQSVPNFSDLRKENTKPSGVSKTATRPQARNYARSKSISEEIPFVKEEKPRRSQTSGKSTASPAEFKDLSSLDSEGIVLTPLKFDKEQTEHTVYDKFPKSVESKPFLRKGNGIGPGAGAVIAKMKASMQPENMNDEEESDELAFEPEESVDEVKDEEEEESEMITEDHASMDNGKPRLSQESDKLLNSGSESGDALRSFSQVDPSFVSELPAAVPSTFHPADSVQDSPTESPVSWNSRMQHAFSYAHETSDVDASADSPMGSPASWNSHSLNQAEADAARMRKKWGSAQKPVLVSNSSHSHSRKDMTKGFKRLLKFARKSRGNESLVDWISATTSEGDDDTEDGRDPANRSSEDLRKSRMGFSQGHPSDDSFNEREFYSEQDQALHSSIPAPPVNFKLREDHLSGSSIKGPRSFFSLSSFRSKGNDSKPR